MSNAYTERIEGLKAENAVLREALTEVRDAKRNVSYCKSREEGRPCLFPQEHTDDETAGQFMDRLRRIARAALAPTDMKEP